ncbi:MetQ/NlpA family ABC transporter substrate-binding protein [Streptococcus hyointestinalis]|uniref:Lipoprotein n=1 Tax=Streptococcus hyointestinalis TaxID=1337 RepID=A0A380KDS2_9STRE|nr:MetQ/NlpA family ABC transporter substrate-binding protein [Streptococcus hyointestinalis]MCI6872323.1 MetQ/NlpA family ABC transporter substrate-binding protein [Streptococcus hyointestinalis]MDD6384471.1 MetQ/NlpA family ABC transporter substrate-binding protein [Streptococcus hyointestinalis]MDD7356323.1 MetQ/NlpA family ABC transporter substrate-binding protein [Streptococcus hyointestinalis]MDY4554262.1 MetQ/NlpA family ABC transporter substrate-binding protein [Streptococcus hyointesti
MKFKKVITGIALATAAALSLAAYTTQNAEAASKSSSKTVKVGVMTFSDTEKARWDKIKELVGDKANIEFTEFTDYTQPNEAVANKEIDINAFQHYNFLENWNKENKQNLVAIADTYLAPIRLYSDKVKKVKSIPKNGTIAIPNDATNESRALYLLQSAGLIKLNVSGTEIATVANITKNPKNLNIQELDASQTARSLKDVDAAVINNTYIEQANLTTDDAIYVEKSDKNSKQWVNVIAARKNWKKQKNAAAIQAIIDAYHTDEVKKVIKDTSSDIPQW